jgi:hypothetical protein
MRITDLHLTNIGPFIEADLSFRESNDRGSTTLTPQEKEALLRFRQPHHAFSLMFDYYLPRVGL